MPAVVGGGAGDVGEVLAAGRGLARAGFELTCYRRNGEPLPAGVDGPWAWPPHLRVTAVAPRAGRALTIAPAWGITCALAREGPLGRGGPWSGEVADVERAYGSGRTVHVSLEEFARTLTSYRENAERFREGGVRSRDLARRLRQARLAGEVVAYRSAFRTFRAFDRPNVLHLYPSFCYDRRFAHEFPEAVQVGPLWEERRGPHRGRARGRRGWVWYASPASAEAIAPSVVAGLVRAPHRIRLFVRSPRPWSGNLPPGLVVVRTGPVSLEEWRRRFRRAALRIVTGSRSLLEALELGRPFLYFNGVVGSGPARRRHRPEKIVRLLEAARAAGWPGELVRDLSDFSRGRRVEEVVARAARADGAWRRFPSPPEPVGFAPGFEDAGKVLVRFARSFAHGGSSAAELVAETRGRSHR